MTQKEVKKLFTYDKNTGIFTRKTALSNRVKIGDILNSNYNGYYAVRTNGKSFYLHRLAWLYYYGIEPNTIDHIDGNKTNNKINNLRNVTQQCNQKNMKKSKANISGHTGIYRHSKNEKWVANICINGKTKYLGSFFNISEAIEIRKKAEIENNFHKNHGIR